MMHRPIAFQYLTILALLTTSVTASSSKPHIVFIVADDLGWNDVSWNNPRMITPNLAKLAKSGIILNSSYVQQVCSPSRNCFMTGYYPYHTGLQHGVIRPSKPGYVPLKFELLPQRLKKLGYSTHIVGKWHLGFCNVKYLPTSRGFDTFLGYYCGAEGYYTHMRDSGYDFRFNETVYHPPHEEYSAITFAKRAVDIIYSHKSSNGPLFLYLPFQSVHGPLQVPRRFEDMYSHVKNKTRRVYSGMVTALDEAVGNITDALNKTKILDNALIVFTTDNGGPVQNGANNWPLRGSKGSLWEGGTRGAAFVYSKTLLKKTADVSNALIHAVDWYPTFIAAAGEKPDDKMDGKSQWPVFTQGIPYARKEMIYNIDGINQNAGIRIGKFKLLVGIPGKRNGWYPEPGDKDTELDNTLHFIPEIQLFDLDADPEERNNLAKNMTAVVDMLRTKLLQYNETFVNAQDFPESPGANPKHFNGVWSPGWCSAS